MSQREEEFQAALDAWEDWCRCKRRSDRTMSFIGCHDTAQAWVRFQNLYLGDNRQLATMPATTSSALPFGGRA